MRALTFFSKTTPSLPPPPTKKRSLSARCRDPPPPGGRAPRIYFGTGKKTTGLKGLGGAPAAEASEEEEEEEEGEEGEEEEASTSSSSPSSPSAQRRRFRTYCKEERAPLAGFASSGFDAGARRVLPRNLLRRAAVLSALELVSGSGEEEGMDDKRRTTRSEGGGGNSLRRVLVRTRIVANSGEEATLTWTVEREDNEANQGCWLVVAVDRDASDDLGPGAAAAAAAEGGGGVGVGALSSPDADAPSPHPRLGPERVACAAALDLASGRPIDRWVWPPVHGWKARAGGRGAAAFEAAAAASGGGGGGRGPSGGPSEREIQQQQSRDLRARWFEIAADVLLHSCPSSSSPVVTVVQSATPEPGWALVETATETAFAGRRGPGFPHFEDPRERRRRKGGGLRTERLQWVLCMGPGGCWGVDAVLRRN